MRVLVTGADGFVGKHVTACLRAHGDEITELRGPSPHHDRGLDLLDAAGVDRFVAEAQPEAVIHLAAASAVAASHASPGRTFAVNTVGTVHLLDALRRRFPTARVLLVGSGEMYGKVPLGERVTEGSALAPMSPYAAAKVAAEVAGFQFFRGYGLPVVSARPFNHLGPGQATTFVMPSFAHQIIGAERSTEARVEVGNLEPIRDFSHVADVAEAYRLLVSNGIAGEAYNVCSGRPRSIRSILGELLTLSGIELDITIDPHRFRPAEIPSLVGDPSKLVALGWKPTRTASDALREVLDEARATLPE